MPRLLVFQHVAFEILGTLDPLLKKSGFRIRYVNFERHPDAQPSIEGYHGLIILGGPMSVYEVDLHPHLLTEVQLIREAIGRGIPILGICLGAQLIARALGAEVSPNPSVEIGWYDVRVGEEGLRDPLFAHFREREKIFQWHSDTFSIPEGAVALASSVTCANQAFRYGDKVYGFQFHMEVDEPLVERWLAVPLHREEIESLAGAVDPQRIRSENGAYVGDLKRIARRTFGAFIDLFGKGA